MIWFNKLSITLWVRSLSSVPMSGSARHPRPNSQSRRSRQRGRAHGSSRTGRPHLGRMSAERTPQRGARPPGSPTPECVAPHGIVAASVPRKHELPEYALIRQPLALGPFCVVRPMPPVAAAAAPRDDTAAQLSPSLPRRAQCRARYCEPS